MKITISVKTPLIIGGMDDILEWDFFVSSGKIRLVDFDRTISNLDRNELDEIISLMKELAGSKGNPQGKPYQWVQSSMDGVHERLMAKYQDLDKKGKLRTFANTFIAANKNFWKNGTVTPTMHEVFYNGNERKMVPYIPGSTIKGSIRRSLLFSLIERNVFLDTHNIPVSEALLNSFRQHGHGTRVSFHDSEVFRVKNEIDREGRDQQAVDDIMRFIQVSDFFPVESTVEMRIVQLNRKTGRRDMQNNFIAVSKGEFHGSISLNPSIVNFLRGSLNASATISRMSTIFGTDRDMLSHLSDADGKRIKLVEKELVTAILSKLDNYTRKNVRNAGNDRYEPSHTEKSIVIGFGKGAPFTTVINGSEEFRERVRNLLKGNRRLLSNISPKTSWKVDNTLPKQGPGLCSIGIDEHEIRTN
jgi:CRISPR type III-A-associated RAMP protein Csm5